MVSNLSLSLNKLKRINCRQTLFKSFCRLVAVNLFVITALFALDNVAAFSAETRFFVLVVFVISNLVLLAKLFIDLYKSRLNDKQAALKIEELHEIKDNSLINAVCFRDDESISDDMRSLFLASADKCCDKLTLSGIWKNKACQKVFKILFIALIIASLYMALLHNYAYNAAVRFVNPWTQLASLNFTQFEVDPGDIRLAAGQNLSIKAKAFRANKKVNNLKILLTSSSNSTLYPMRSGSGIASFELTNISEAMSYKILSGKDSSRDFKIEIIPKPKFKKFALEVIPPAYTRLKSFLYDIKMSDIAAPAGSKINIKGTNFDGDKTEIFWGKDSKSLPCSFTLNKDTLGSATITKNGIKYPNIWRCAFSAKKDMPPQPRFMNRQNNIEASLGQSIPLHITAEDDYGVRALRVIISNQGRKGVYKQFDYSQAPLRSLREALMLKITPEMCSVDTVLEVSIQALDTGIPGQTGLSESNLTIHIVDLVKKLKEDMSASNNTDMYKLLFKTIERQQEVRNWLSVRAKKIRRWEFSRLINWQKEIKKLLVSATNKAKRIKKDFAASIQKIADNNAEKLVISSQKLPKKNKKRELEQKINIIVNDQSILIQKIKVLLGIIAAKEIKEKEEKELLAEDEQQKEFFDKLKDVRDKLGEFMEEQKKIITETEAIDKKDPEDWSDADEKLLGDLAARELDWAKFFKAAFNDLSKLQNQDFSNSAMADELVEMYEELQKAGDALNKKKIIEIATLAENTAMDSSVSVAANLDRWLADNKDSIKWNAEESGEAPDIPLTDLPTELTDIIGDLIETEDDMGEDTQDSTNSFSYSSDEGLGWGVSDGNIDSMQAKGITGNVLPNNNEVGGRSGEGRSGKSSGQFVEKTATGKGGRKTPTRLTQSPYEKGTVEDTSKDAQGGASGGGKQSGVGNEGLVGITPDQDPDIKERLAGTQGELRQRAEALLRKLGKRDLPTGELRKALSKMAELKNMQTKGKEVEIKQLKKEIGGALRNAKIALVLSINAGQEKVKRQKMQNFTVKHEQKEKIPTEYQDCVSGYFKALATEE
jgi:hypothetical protein